MGSTPLRRDRDFVLFWSGQGVSLVGAQVTAVVLPLVAVTVLDASATGVGILQACVFAAFVGLPLLAGVYVDRHRKRPVMVGANLVRVVLMVGVPVVAALGGLSLPLLCAVAVVSGACAVLFEVAEMAYIPFLAGRDRLAEANSATIGAWSAANLAGPGIGGLVARAAGPVGALLVTAGTYLVSVVSLAAVRRREPAPDRTQQRELGREIADGLRAVLGNPPVRIIAFQGMLFNLFGQLILVAFLLYAVRERNLSVGWYGLVLTGEGLGALVGSALAVPAARRFGYGPAFILLAVVGDVVLLAIPAVEGPTWVLLGVWFGAYAINGCGSTACSVISYTLRQAFTPDRLLGRMSASMRLILYAGIPVGATLGGVLAAALGARGALWVGAAGMAASVALLRPLWAVRTLPVHG